MCHIHRIPAHMPGPCGRYACAASVLQHDLFLPKSFWTGRREQPGAVFLGDCSPFGSLREVKANDCAIDRSGRTVLWRRSNAERVVWSMCRTFCWRSTDDLPRLRLAGATTAGLATLAGEESESSMWKLSRSGEDRASLGAYSYCSLHLDNVGYGSFALRQVASRAKLA